RWFPTVFFFSSRRRHTRFSRDWSSDVCSSDLAADTEYDWPYYGQLMGAWFASHPAIQQATVRNEDRAHAATAHLGTSWTRTDERSEERRVGKECRSGRSREHREKI